MQKRPLNYKIEFDGQIVTQNKQRDVFLSLVKCLMRLSAQSQIKNKKFSSQKERLEQQIYINNYYQKYYKVLLKILPKICSNTDND